MDRLVPTYQLYGEKSGQKSDFWLHCETIPARSRLHHWEIRPHRHDNFFQILYIFAGSGDAVFDSESHDIRPASIVTVPPGLNHAFRFSRDVDGLVITVLASQMKAAPGDRSPLGAWLGQPHLIRLEPENEDAAYAASSLLRLGEEFAGQRAGRTELLDAYLTSALRLSLRISLVEQDERREMDEGESRMERLNGLLQQHLRSHKPAAFYADALGISPTHLNRVVRRMTGQSAHELIAGKLLDLAKRELVFTFGSIQEIGYRLGFADPAYFSRFFLKRTGQTPRNWRIAAQRKLGGEEHNEP